MNKERIWISPPHLGGKEIEYVKDAFDKNWITTIGDNVTGFEKDIQSYLGGKEEVVALNSGTSALHLALLLQGVEKEDLVICQDLTFVATIDPVVYIGAEPVFVGSERQTWNLSPVFLEEAIQACIDKGRKPKVIIWVNLYGMPAQIDEIRKISQKYHIPLLEDAAESLGSSYAGRKCGTWGDFSVFSFNGNKIITTSGGGVLVSADKEKIRKARFLASQARDEAPWYQHSQIGYNYGMSNIVAGIGRGQMHVLSQRIEQRRKNNACYREHLAAIPGISFQTEPSPEFFSNYWLTVILIDPEKTNGITREDVRIALENENIESRPMWKPMHLQPVFENCSYYGDTTGEDLFNQGLCLPSGSTLTEEHLNRIIKVIKKQLVHS
jgi:dTDP-4-amino-4,6-dideoxygalactose transaminase